MDASSQHRAQWVYVRRAGPAGWGGRPGLVRIGAGESGKQGVTCGFAMREVDDRWAAVGARGGSESMGLTKSSRFRHVRVRKRFSGVSRTY